MACKIEIRVILLGLILAFTQFRVTQNSNMTKHNVFGTELTSFQMLKSMKINFSHFLRIKLCHLTRTLQYLLIPQILLFVFNTSCGVSSS